MPFFRILFSIGCHLWYSQLLPDYPYIELSSATFVLSVGGSSSGARIEDLGHHLIITSRFYTVLVVADHLTWFLYFTKHYYTMLEIGTFFGLLVWAVPFMYFLSLSANEYTLPAFGNLYLSILD